MDKHLREFLVRLLLRGYVVGFDSEVVDGRVRVFVRDKNDVRLYNLQGEFEGVKLEYVEVGEFTLLSSEVPNRRKFRPVKPGCSVGVVGHGTGTLTGVFEDGRGNRYLASNAHVFVPDPGRCPENVGGVSVVQPGPHDGGSSFDVVGVYAWHQPVVTLENPVSCCRVSRFVASILSRVGEVLGRRTRFVARQVPVNYIDFAVAKPLVDFDVEPVGLSLGDYRIVGVGFAGSLVASAAINIYNIMQAGFKPVGFTPSQAGMGVQVVKSGRSTGVTRGVVLAPSVVLAVKLREGTAIFGDVILLSKMFEPGDSGSPVFRVS